MFVSIVIFQHKYHELKKLIDKLILSHVVERIVLVDNGGCRWADNLANPKVEYIKSPKNGGFGYGHNLAINKFAHMSDYFLICNPDIDFDNQQLERFYTIAKNSDSGLFSPKIVYPDGSNQYGQRLLPHPFNLFARRFLPRNVAQKLDNKYLLKDFLIKKPVSVSYVSGSFMLFRSECLLALGGFDERYFMYMEDIDLSRRCAARFGVLYIPDAYIIHEHQQESYKNKALLKAHVVSAIQYFNKWGWFIDKDRKRVNSETIDNIKKTT